MSDKFIPNSHIEEVAACWTVGSHNPNEVRRQRGLSPYAHGGPDPLDLAFVSAGEEPPCEPNHVVG